MIPAKDEFNETLEKIAAEPEYKILRWKNHASDFVGRLKEDFVRWLVKQSADGNWDISPSFFDKLADLFIIIGAVVIIIIIMFVIIMVIESFNKEVRVKEILGEEIKESTTPRSLKDKALKYEKMGKLRQAIRYDFIALLYLMHEESILYLDQTRTNQEIYRYLERVNFPWLDNLQKLITIFNSTWYGHKSCDYKVYNKWTSNINRLWNEVLKYEEKNR